MRRRTRFILVAHALTAAFHVLPGAALAHAFGVVGVALGVGLWLAVALRLQRLGHDQPRPRWLTRLVDEPLFAHWFGAALGLVFWPVTAGATLSLGVVSPLAALPATAAAAYGLGLCVALWGTYVTRRRVRIERVALSFSDLPRAFDGYRIVQLTDLHVGSYDRVERGLQWVALANDLNADVIVVTGDLVTAGTSFYADAARVVGELRARDGVLVVMGNHDQWDNDALTRDLQARGVRVLKNSHLCIEREGQALQFAGLDDAYTGKDDLSVTLSAARANFTVLLSHYPRFFDEAVQKGARLTLSGHTHGGQFAVPGLAKWLNLARMLGQHPRGSFGDDRGRLHVSAGLGTTGPPIRLGIRPEISCITLMRAEGRRSDPHPES